MNRLLLRISILVLVFVAGYAVHHYFGSSWEKKQGHPVAEKRGKKSKQRRPVGFWFNSDRENAAVPRPSEEAIENLEALGYADGIRKATRKKGVVLHDAALIQPGLNYYTSGHAPEAFLMKSSGEIVHRWKLRFDRAFPEADAQRRKALGTRYWRSIHLFDNGDMLAIYEGIGLVKLDKNSRLIWKYNGYAHHDLHVQPDGSIYVLTRKPRSVAPFNDGNPIWEDFITVLDSNGKEKHELSILKAVQNSIYESVLTSAQNIQEADLFHTNTVEVMDGRLAQQMPFLKKGNILVSLCFVDTVAVVDPSAGKVVWALSKMWSKQHAPLFLPNGDLIVYDNEGASGKSRILQIRPLTQDIVWTYEHADFYSEILGFAQRLENGNTLITDSDDGKAFEVTPAKKIVWEFHNPNRAGSSQEFVAVIPEMIRLSPQYPTDWIP